jgi:phospholipase/lecithinase/hemolysin
MATIHWRTGISGAFTNALDWSTNTVPGAGDDVAIDATGTYTVTVSASRTIRTLKTVSTATLAVTGGTFTITNGTGAGANAGTIRVSNGANLAIGGTFDNSGKVQLNATSSNTDLIIVSNVTLSGGGIVALNAGGTLGSAAHGGIIGKLANPFASTVTLTNAGDTIAGAGSIGGSKLVLVNQATIDGNGKLAALTLNTGTHRISNSGLLEGTTARGLVVVSDVANSAEVEAAGTNARLVLDGILANSSHGSVSTSGSGAHVDLSSAAITGGSVSVGSGGIVQSLGGSGLSTISGAAVSGAGTLQANHDSTLSVTSSTIDTATTLMSNGIGSVLSVDGTVGALAGTINSGEIEFKGASAVNVSFAAGTVGTLKLDASFSGTVSGFAGAVPMTFTKFFGFGDSTIDSGALQYLSPDLPSPPNPGITDRLANALAAGGTNAPVGVGLMNSQVLAADFGLTADTAYTTGGAVGGGGTNYAIAGALDAADAGSGNDPGNGSVSNINQAGKPNPDPALLSTVAQLETYLGSVGGVADPSALYLVSSGGNDFSYANKFITDPTQQQAYLAAQAQTLASEIEKLYADGARHIIVNGSENNHSLALFYTQQLFADLDASGIAYTKSDIHALLQDVMTNPTAYGFTATTVHPGVVGTSTESALIEPDTVNGLSGWGLWGANTTTPDSSQQLNHQYSYLALADAEQTHFFADDQHLSAAGQQIQADLDRNLVTDDAIDLTSLSYEFGQTGAGFSGTSAGGTLTVSNGLQHVNIALLGNYMASTFVTASDGTGGTLVMDQSSAAPPQLLAATHG